MSIIISMITDKCGITASDGRVTSSAVFQNGQVITKAVPINENFEKTFSLDNGKLIGTWAGIMTFAGKTIPEHLAEIFSIDCPQLPNLENTLSCLISTLKDRFRNNTEILFEFRKIDLIIVATDTGRIQDLRTYTFRLKPNDNNDQIIIEHEIIPNEKKQPNIVYWKIFGDDSSRPFVDEFLRESIEKSPNVHVDTLVSIAYKAIRLGIKYSGKHSYGDDKTCGGKPFVREIK